MTSHHRIYDLCAIRVVYHFEAPIGPYQMCELRMNVSSAGWLARQCAERLKSSISRYAYVTRGDVELIFSSVGVYNA